MVYQNLVGDDVEAAAQGITRFFLYGMAEQPDEKFFKGN
jgi:hypothetical protein